MLYLILDVCLDSPPDCDPGGVGGLYHPLLTHLISTPPGVLLSLYFMILQSLYICVGRRIELKKKKSPNRS